MGLLEPAGSALIGDGADRRRHDRLRLTDRRAIAAQNWPGRGR
jgi:hypothetical protein